MAVSLTHLLALTATTLAFGRGTVASSPVKESSAPRQPCQDKRRSSDRCRHETPEGNLRQWAASKLPPVNARAFRPALADRRQRPEDHGAGEVSGLPLSMTNTAKPLPPFLVQASCTTHAPGHDSDVTLDVWRRRQLRQGAVNGGSIAWLVALLGTAVVVRIVATRY
jgi:hypothetical protein